MNLVRSRSALRHHAWLHAGPVVLSLLLGTAFIDCASGMEESDANSLQVPDAEAPGFDRDSFIKGKAVFEARWRLSDFASGRFSGLGPSFNQHSCASCHIHNGRGSVPREGKDFGTLIIRTSYIDTDPNQELSQLSSYGQSALEKWIAPRVLYEPLAFPIPGRPDESLRTPSYYFVDGKDQRVPNPPVFSPRTPPPLVGMGLIDKIPDQWILDIAASQAKMAGPVRGRPALRKGVGGRIGRFGWKAEAGSLRHQILNALQHDMGIEFHSEPAQTEISESDLNGLEQYMRFLKVPVPRQFSDEGAMIFARIGCNACHVASSPIVGQPIPYSDFLLHDMGPSLADPNASPNATLWRTQPLWGVGLASREGKSSFFLHDGRARSLTEAILWHGGEGAGAKANFITLSPSERMKLIEYLESL